MDLVGEGMGARQQQGLRRRAFFEAGELTAILQGCILGRGAQTKSDQGEATVPSPTDMVWVHLGHREEAKKEVKRAFRLESSKSEAIDCNLLEVSIIFNEESIRARKMRIKGPYSQTSSLWCFSQKILVPEVLQEKRRSQYAGWNTGNVIGFVDLFPERSLWDTNRLGNKLFEIGLR